MRKYILVFASAILFSSCSKVDDLLTFDIDNSVSITVPSSAGIDVPFPIPTPDIPSNSNQVFANNNTRADLVKEVKLSKLDLTITSPSGKTFSFLKSIVISISADGLPEKEIAFLNNISESAGNSISLETSDEKLDEYIKKEKYNITTEVVIREAFLQDVKFDADMTFSVKADLL